MRKPILLFAIGVFMALVIMGFVPQEDFSACKKELKSYVNQLAKINLPMGKKVYYMKMSIKTDMSTHSKIPDSETLVEVFMSEHQLRYISDVLVTYQDEENAFAVLPQRKMIVWSTGGKRADGKEKRDLAIHIQDTLISVSKVIGCNTVDEDGTTLKQLTMIPYKKALEAFKINRIEYFINSDKKKIQKVNTFYQPGGEIEMRSIVYHELNLNYSKASLLKPVYQQIFNESGKLLSRYKGYQIIDNRN